MRVKKLHIGNNYKKEKLLLLRLHPSTDNVSEADVSVSSKATQNEKQSSSSKKIKSISPKTPNRSKQSSNREQESLQSFAVWSAAYEPWSLGVDDTSQPSITSSAASSTLNTVRTKSAKTVTINSKQSRSSDENSFTSITKKKSSGFINIFKGKHKKQALKYEPPSTISSRSLTCSSFHTTASTATEKRSNTVKISGKASSTAGRKSFLKVIEEDSHSVFSGESKQTQMSEQLDKRDNDLICNLIRQSSKDEEKKIFKKASESDYDPSASECVDESDLLFGDEEEYEIQHQSKPKVKSSISQSDTDYGNKIICESSDSKFFERVINMFSPKTEQRDDSINNKSKSKKSEKRDAAETEAPVRSLRHEIVNIDLDGIDIISLPVMMAANGHVPKYRFDRMLQTMTPGILLESEFESSETLPSKSVTILMEGYDNIRWYVSIPIKVFDNINVNEQVGEVIDIPPMNKSSKKVHEISLSKMKHTIAKHIQKGELSMALNVLNESLPSLLKKRSSNIHPTLGAHFHNIGNLNLMLGLYDEAKASYLAAIRARVKKLSDEHPDVVASLHKFGICLYTMSSLDDAQSIFLRTIEKLYKAHDCDERMDQIGKVMNNLACIQFEKGDYVSALKVFQTSLNLLSRESSPSLTFATVLCNMSHVFMKRGEVLESSILLEQAVSIQKNLLREDHEVVKGTIQNMNYIFSLTQKFKRSEKVTDDLIKSLETKLPENSCQERKFHC